MKKFLKFFSKIPGIGDIVAAVQTVYDIYRDQRNWNDMAPSKKEEMTFSDDLADQNAIDAYNRELEFYDTRLSPEMQMRSTARGYEALGLNKMLMAGSSPGATTSSSPSAGTPSASGNPSTPVDFMGTVSQLLGIKQRQALNDAEVNLKNETAKGVSIENKYKDEYQRLTLNNLKLQAANLSANTRKLTADAEYSEHLALYAPDLFEANIADSTTRAALNTANAKVSAQVEKLTQAQRSEVYQKIQNHVKQRELMDAQIDKIYDEILTLASQRNVNDQQILESNERISKMQKEVEKLGAEIGLSELDTKFYIWNHPRTNSLPGGIKWNRSSENGRNGFSIVGLTDEELLAAARARGLIEE